MKKGFPVATKYSKTTIYAVGTAIALGVSVLMLLLFALIMTFVNIQKAYAFPLASVALGVGSFMGARYAAKKQKEKGYLCGLIIGFFLFLISTIVAMIVNGLPFTALTPLRAVINILMGMIGGITGINSSGSRSLVK